MSTDAQRETHPPESDAALDDEPVFSHRTKRRAAWILLAVLVLLLLVVLPPLIKVGRYQRRVAQAISQSIGRPVHFDEIHLHLLPLPGMTIQNFVVQEDPAFGNEPTLRANTVEARLRLSSLWRRRVEVSRISLQAPSINLVRLPDGRWNLQGVVTQAGYLQSAPTAQQSTGRQPRFPYLEATDARINIKNGQDKLPWSLLDAKLALWLPEQTEWRVRLRGRPLRTDTDVSDVGGLQLEGSLGRGSVGTSDQPLALSVRWASTPLGEAAKLVVGQDTGFRGAASAEMEVRGTPARMRLTTDLHLHNLRRAEFVPRLPMSIDAHCETEAMGIAHELHHLRCAIPTAQSGGFLEGVFRFSDEHVMEAPDVLAIHAEVPNLLEPKSATVTADLKGGKPEYFLNWLRVFSSRIPEAVSADGTVGLHADWNAAGTPENWNLGATCTCILKPRWAGSEPETAQIAAKSDAEVQRPWVVNVSHSSLTLPGEKAQERDALEISAAQSVSLPKDVVPPMVARVDDKTSIGGQITMSGSTLQYASGDLARYAASLLPPLGDYLPSEYTIEPGWFLAFRSERTWGQTQRWTTTASAAPAVPARHRHHP